MSQLNFWDVDVDTVTRSLIAGGGNEGCGHSERFYAGDLSGTRYRSYVKFDPIWTGVGRIIKATLIVYTDDGAGLFPLPSDSDAPAIYIQRLITAFAAGNNADGDFDASDFTNPTASNADQVVFSGLSKAANGLNRIDVTDLVEDIAPKTVQKRNGAPGGGYTNHGFKIHGAVGTKSAWSGWSSEHSPSGQRPQIELEFDLGPTVPDVPTALTPSGSVTSLTAFEGDFTDDKPEDELRFSEVEIYPGTATNAGQVVTGTRIAQRKQAASAGEIQADRFSNILSVSLTTGVTYKWRARVTDQEGQTSPWTDLVSFSISNTPPAPPVPSPSDATFATLNGVLFRGGEFFDADGDTLRAYQIQMSQLDPDSPLWDDAEARLWNTGKVYVSAGDTNWQTAYGGPPLQAGAYTWRAKQWDSRDGESDWAYDTFTLTEDFTPLLGTQSSVQQTIRTPWRVILRGLGAGRGPGKVVAILENAKSLGASVYYNFGGEFHMTLPIDNQQLQVIKLRQTHYSVEFYTGDGWRKTFVGLITDADPTETSVVFYGIDYLGLFATQLDKRWDPDNPDLPSESGGSKYVTKTIKYIVTDQLQRAIDRENSPVGFITIGDIDDMDEEVTIWTTMMSALSAVAGLIDSHRQGSGKNTRVFVREKTDGGWEVTVQDDPGQERPGLTLRYGELVQNYQFKILGGAWATVQSAIGRLREGLRALYDTQTAPGLDLATWGAWDAVKVFENVSDGNDMIRRTKQAALEAGKIGVGVAIALRSGWLQPLDGYDITDHIPIEVIHGYVDTRRWGSGMWTVYGVQWEGGDEGSQATTPVFRPRNDEVLPQDDIVRQIETLSPQDEWQDEGSLMRFREGYA